MMSEQEKSLKLAEISGMYGKLFDDEDWSAPRCYVGDRFLTHYQPYSDNESGLAQFVDLLFRFPNVMACQFPTVCLSDGYVLTRNNPVKPTQANFLDEILRMHGEELV